MNASFFARRLTSALALLVAGLFLLPASLQAQDTTREQGTMPPPEAPPPQTRKAQAPDLVNTLKEHGNFTTLVSALKATDLAKQISGKRAYTIFAPTDAAFDRLPTGTLDSLSNEQLRRVLRYHVVSERVKAADLAADAKLKTAQGGTLTFEQADGGVTVNGAPLSETDIETKNGVIHVIGRVLMPKEMGASMGEAGGGTEGASGDDTAPR